MFCYLEKPRQQAFEETLERPAPSPSLETEKVIDENGYPVTRQVLRDPSNHPLKGLKSKDFELDLLVASGATGLLKEMPLIGGNKLAQLDSIEAQSEHLSTLKID